MQPTIKELTRQELFKIIHKKESYLFCTMWLIPLMYGIGFATGSSAFSYSGPGNISMLDWLQTSTLMVQRFFIFHIFALIIAARSLGGEIDDHSLLLQIPRVNDRRRIFWAKAAALALLVLVTYLVHILISVLVYWTLLVPSTDFVSGVLIGDTSVSGSGTMMAASLLSCLLLAWLGLTVSLYLRLMLAIATGVVSLIGLTLLAGIPPIAYLNPFFYLARVDDLVNDRTGTAMTSNPDLQLFTQSAPLVGLLAIVSVAGWLILLTLLGRRRFVQADL